MIRIDRIDVEWPSDWRYGGGWSVINGQVFSSPGIANVAWDTMSNGYDFEFTRQWIFDHYWELLTPNPDQLRRGDNMVAPFYNWRFWGNPYVCPF
ncbi:MAG: hypothetical protein HYX78_09955 [Armatimonadetes bacterium]|nr:hypothetical protein [Armatimonadota bacterium]